MGKHLTLDDRTAIQQGLTSGLSLNQIASELNRSLCVISREVRKHRLQHNVGAYGRVTNRCIYRSQCRKFGICPDQPDCTRKCSSCKLCNSHCSEFLQEHCQRLNTPPYVCNGCEHRNRCVLEKYLYDAKDAQIAYEKQLRACREGFNMTEAELQTLDGFVSPLMKVGQSVYHIAATQSDELTRSPRTIYRLLHSGCLHAKSIDAPRICRLKPRKSRIPTFKVEKNCRINRTYQDYLSFVERHPGCSVIQMDSVIGRQGGKVLLTLHLTSFDFMIAILREHNTARSVTESLAEIRKKLGEKLFSDMFTVVLTDNGSEFSNPSAIEFEQNGETATHVFYCDPGAAYQKANIELNHEFIRRFLPKGSSFDKLTQDDVSLMMSHINSYARGKFGGQSPAQMLVQAYGEGVLHLLGQEIIPPEKITLKPSVFPSKHPAK